MCLLHLISSYSLGRLPQFIFIGAVTSAAYHGSQNLNPFSYGQHGIKSISIRLDDQIFPQPACDIDWTNELGVNTYYQSFLDALNFGSETQANNGITRDAWTNKSKTIFGWNMNSDMAGKDEHASRPYNSRGLLRITIEFTTPPTDALSILAWGIFQEEVRSCLIIAFFCFCIILIRFFS